MALKIRRGLQTHLSSITPAEGELIYTTDTKKLFVGDGATTGNMLPTVSSAVVSVNGAQGPVTLTTDDISEGGDNKYFTNDRAQDVAGSLLANATVNGITFTYDSNTNALTATTTAQGTINSGELNTLAYYPTNGTTLQSTVNLGWNENTNILTLADGVMNFRNNSGNSSPLVLDGFHTNALGNAILLRRSRGTSTAPTAVVNTDVLHAVNFAGYDGTQYKISASMYASVVQTVSTNIVPTGLTFTTTDTTGTTAARVRITETGRLFLGPLSSTDLTSGGLTIRQTIAGAGTGAGIAFRNTFNDAGGPTFALSKYRGTVASPATVQTGDSTGQIDAYGFDGTSSIMSSAISMTVDGSVTSAKVPGAITLRVANQNGAMTSVVKINNASTSTLVGTMTVSGTIATASTPGTFWNYDSSASTISLTIGQVVTFANFSGSVLVNCYNSGTVSQYLCGSGGTPVCIGSSAVSQTGTMQAISGGYTFTATETGVHSFYVIRTRTGA